MCRKPRSCGKWPRSSDSGQDKQTERRRVKRAGSHGGDLGEALGFPHTWRACTPPLRAISMTQSVPLTDASTHLLDKPASNRIKSPRRRGTGATALVRGLWHFRTRGRLGWLSTARDSNVKSSRTLHRHKQNRLVGDTAWDFACWHT